MLRLLQIPVWRDNYAYLVVHGTRAFVVDSPEASPVLQTLQDLGDIRLEAVVNTHHHGDHVGSNLELAQTTGCDIVGPAHDAARIPGLTRPVRIGETFDVAGIDLEVLDVRAHTRGHVAYVCEDVFDEVVRHGHGREPVTMPSLAGRPALFVGDSLFAGGCGRLFEGTRAELLAAMRTLADRDPRSLVCCAHEYTESNLRFALDVLPELAPLRMRQQRLAEQLASTGTSVPDTLELELATNPFLLVLRDDARALIGRRLGSSDTDPVTVCGDLRSAKDHF